MNGWFVSAFLLCVGLFRLFELFWLERKKQPGRVVAPWTLLGLSVGYALLLASTAAEYVVVDRPFSLPLSVAGFAVILLRMPVKYWAARTLDRYWSPQVEIRDGHRLVTAGPYRYLRHPAYFSAVVDLVAVPCLANAWFTLATVSPLLLAMILVRIRIEERALVAVFGDGYREYMSRTFALIPLPKLISVPPEGSPAAKKR